MTLEKEKTLIIIPAFNEEKHIENVVKKAKHYGFVIVVDDGSTDKTTEKAFNQDVIVLRKMKNEGKASAILEARRFIRLYWDCFKDYNAVVILDADEQHIPNNIPELVKPLMR